MRHQNFQPDRRNRILARRSNSREACALEKTKRASIRTREQPLHRAQTVPPKSGDKNIGRRASGEFRRRYNNLESQREVLMNRLRLLGRFNAKHPAYANAQALLTRTFRGASVTQRVAILNAASWLLDVLEKLTTVS
jgi:hypothetical protein